MAGLPLIVFDVNETLLERPGNGVLGAGPSRRSLAMTSETLQSSLSHST
jgi:hypothetical protein